jgi:hypothetical protein
MFNSRAPNRQIKAAGQMENENLASKAIWMRSQPSQNLSIVLC